MPVQFITQVVDASGRIDRCDVRETAASSRPHRVVIASDRVALAHDVAVALQPLIGGTAQACCPPGLSIGSATCRSNVGRHTLLVVADQRVSRRLTRLIDLFPGPTAAVLDGRSEYLPTRLRRIQSVRYSTRPSDALEDIAEAVHLTVGDRRAFISYARPDEPSAVELSNQLRRRGFRPFLDVHDIAAGSNWSQALYGGIVDRGFLIVLESNSSTASAWVGREVAFAQGAGIPVVAVRLDPGASIARFVPRRATRDMQEAADFAATQHRIQLNRRMASVLLSLQSEGLRQGVPMALAGSTIATRTGTTTGTAVVDLRPARTGTFRRAATLNRRRATACVVSPAPVSASKRNDQAFLEQSSGIARLDLGRPSLIIGHLLGRNP